MITVVFVLKSGVQVKVKCEEFTLSTDKFTGLPTSYEIKGISENKPIFINWNEVSMVYRVLSDEND